MGEKTAEKILETEGMKMIFRRTEVDGEYAGKDYPPNMTLFELTIPLTSMVWTPNHLLKDPKGWEDLKGIIATQFASVIGAMLYGNLEDLVIDLERMIKDSHEHTGRPFPLPLQNKINLIRKALDVGKIDPERIPDQPSKLVTNEGIAELN